MLKIVVSRRNSLNCEINYRLFLCVFECDGLKSCICCHNVNAPNKILVEFTINEIGNEIQIKSSELLANT